MIEQRAYSKADLLRVPALERERPVRDRLLPPEMVVRLLLWTLSVACIVCYISIASWAHAHTTVPDIEGMPEATALATLEEAGLYAFTAGTRNSARPAGEVILQIPAAGERINLGDSVSLTLSSGVAGFAIPDVLGSYQGDARLDLQRLGLQVEVRQLQSEAAPGTVLLTTPIAGTAMQPQDPANPETIILYVATHIGGAKLVDYRLNSLRVVIEPQYTTTVHGDISFDVARRLASLFEAADAEVTVMRSSTEREIDIETYETRIFEARPELHIILSIGVTPDQSGITVRAPSADPETTGAMVFDGLEDAMSDVNFEVATFFGYADDDKTVEVILGSVSNVADLSHFAETFWRDRIARSIYMSSGAQFAELVPDAQLIE
ncbi:MAG: PASTA domain-containing protein [Coriobacteriia bacterium]|nr:PASTA domain-containing protein [Coriobacteriia bacterium]